MNGEFMKLNNKNEQRLSLNGGFGILAYLLQAIDNNEITSIGEMRETLLTGMKDIHEEITKLENTQLQ